MKKMFKMVGMVLLFVLLFSIPVQAKTTIKLNKTKAVVYVNSSVQLKATVKGRNAKVKWSTSNKKIAAVNSKGKVTAKKAGTTTITAKVNGKTAKCKVTVKKASIKLNKSSATLYISGAKIVKLKATVKGASSKVKWKSGNSKIAVVNSKGVVTAKKTGTTTITATANGKTAKCKISVKKKTGLTKEEQHKLYRPVMKAYDQKMRRGAAKYGECGSATYYVFADIDKNGTDELIMRYDWLGQSSHATNVDNGYGETTYIYTIKKGKVKTVLSSGEYNPYYHTNFVQIYRGSSLINRGFSHMPSDEIFYNYRNGTLSSKASLHMVGGGMWIINNQKVSRQEWEKTFKKATNGHVGYQMSRYVG